MSRSMQGKKPDRWERDAGGAYDAKDDLEEDFFGEAGEDLTLERENMETHDTAINSATRKGKGISQIAKFKEVNLEFVIPLYTSRSNDIVIRDSSQQVTVKNNMVYEGDLGLELCGHEDKTRKRKGWV